MDRWATVRPGGLTGQGDEVPEPVLDIAEKLLRLPRHLGVHPGGMVLCDRPVTEVCPVRWAAMDNRSVLQWDKDDCSEAGLVKFDLLGLGALTALRLAFTTLAERGQVVPDVVEEGESAQHPDRPSLGTAHPARGGSCRLPAAHCCGHGRGLPGRVARADGHPAPVCVPRRSTTSSSRSPSSAQDLFRATPSTPTSAAG